MKKITAFLLFIMLATGVTHAQSADAIASKYVEAIGGAQKWKALKSRKMTITLNQNGFDIPGSIISDARNRQKFSIEFQGMKMVQAYDGTTAWGINQFMGETAPKKFEGAQAEQLADAQFLDEFIDHKKRGYALTYDGQETLEGATCDKVKLVKTSGAESVHYFDKDSGLQLGQKQVTNGQEVFILYSDYSEVEGLLMPMKITQKMGTATAFTITINQAEVNVEVTDDMFAFPDK